MALPFSYHWRNLFVRRSTTVLTVLVVGAVVGVFVWMLSFAAALQNSMRMASDAQKLIVLKRGATSESSSAIDIEEFNRLSQLTGAETDPATGHALLSPEMMVQVQLPRRADDGKTSANVAVRGVTDVALKVHHSIKPEGQLFSTGVPEVIVGRSAAKQFQGLEIGKTIDLGYGGTRGFKIVGFFSADGGPMESEIWGYLPTLMNAYNRTMYSSVALRLQDGIDPEGAIKHIEGPAIQLTAQTEPVYWSKQSRLIRIYLGIAYLLVAIMSLAAVFSIANTMFSTVAGRTREIAMLRTIGFSRRQVLGGFLLEAVLLSLLGALLGCLACAAWLQIAGNTKDMFGADTFTSLAFEIHVTLWAVSVALAAVALVGVLGAFLPALRASRLGVVTALREG